MFPESKTRQALRDTVEAMTRMEQGQAGKPGEYNGLISKGRFLVDRLQWGREQYGLPRLDLLDLYLMIAYIQKAFLQEEEEIHTTSYDVDDLTKGYVPFWDDRPALDDFEESEEREAHTNYTDPEWSAEFLDEIFWECDPEGQGVMTCPKLTHNHKGVLETLKWLTGVGRGKEGICNDPRLTPDDRQDLLQFARESWNHWKGIWAEKKQKDGGYIDSLMASLE